MAPKNLILRSFTWAVVYTSLFVLTLGGVLISLVVGDWIMLRTGNTVLAWVTGSIVLTGFLATLGGGVGFWLWLRGPVTPQEVTDRHDTMDKLLKDMSVLDRD
jgi:hypothetical protein